MESSHEDQLSHGGAQPPTDVLPESATESTYLPLQEPAKPIADAQSETTVADIHRGPAQEHSEHQNVGAQLKTPVADAEPAKEHGGDGVGQQMPVADGQPAQKDEDVEAEQPMLMADVAPGQAHGAAGAGQQMSIADGQPAQRDEDVEAERPLPTADVEPGQANGAAGAGQQVPVADGQPAQRDEDVEAEQPLPTADLDPGQALGETGDEQQMPIGTNLEVDSSETDSTLGETVSNATTSVTSSVFAYRYEHGRRYHAYADDVYILPNDEAEADRLDLQHEVWKISLNRALYLAPIARDGLNILDVGTGTGIWAIELAEEQPASQITGTDLSPIQPSWVPPNCQFEIDNAEETWTFPKPFDYIHARVLMMGMHDWPRFFEQAFEHLKPGGWVEVQELCFPLGCDDGSAGPETAFLAWAQRAHDAAAKIGINTCSPPHFPEYLANVGFINIKEHHAKWPLGPWARGEKEKLMGHYMLENVLGGVEGASLMLFTKVLGWTKDEVEVDLASVRREMMDRRKHVYCPMYVHYAQKPPLPDSAMDSSDG